jgi:hypothetical protein
MNKEKVSNVSTSIAALLGFACPACFPAVIAALSSVGFGFLASAKVIVPILFIFLFGGWFGLWLGYKLHKNITPLILSILAGVMIPVGRFVLGSQPLAYLASGLVIIAAVWNILLLRHYKKVCAVDAHNKNITKSGTLTCPECGVQESLPMPTNACQHSYECKGCHKNITPKEGDCCVFCSYADKKCPIKQ